MNYLNGSFSVGGSNEAYRNGWERTFGKKAEPEVEVAPEPKIESAVLHYFDGPCGCGLCGTENCAAATPNRWWRAGTRR